MVFKTLPLLAALAMLLPANQLNSQDTTRYLLKIEASDSFQRTLIAHTGAAIEEVTDNYVIAIATLEEKEALQRHHTILAEASLDVATWSFPAQDQEYHEYEEVEDELNNLYQEFPNDMKIESIGKSVEGRNIWLVKISKDINKSNVTKPAVSFMAGHHAREHLSVEVPLRFTKWFMRQWAQGDPRIHKIMETRELHLIPMVNPDGMTFDIAGGRYKTWRKNRTPNRNGTFGVDLNRNYAFKWGTGGSSNNPSSDTYMGTKPFSEPETSAVKDYLTAHKNVSILVSFHTFSELILYPWGHTRSKISNTRDQQLYEKMAQTMAQWNKYKPMSSADLYVASGDLTDWSYGELGIISFTFELDPKNSGFGGSQGFYPGAKAIEPAVNKNIEPCLYLLEYADDPYRALAN